MAHHPKDQSARPWVAIKRTKGTWEAGGSVRLECSRAVRVDHLGQIADAISPVPFARKGILRISGMTFGIGKRRRVILKRVVHDSSEDGVFYHVAFVADFDSVIVGHDYLTSTSNAWLVSLPKMSM